MSHPLWHERMLLIFQERPVQFVNRTLGTFSDQSYSQDLLICHHIPQANGVVSGSKMCGQKEQVATVPRTSVITGKLVVGLG